MELSDAMKTIEPVKAACKQNGTGRLTITREMREALLVVIHAADGQYGIDSKRGMCDNQKERI